MIGNEQPVGIAVPHDPGIERRGDAEGLDRAVPGVGEVALADDVLEVDAELAQQQEVGVETALVEIEDVIGPEIEEVTGLFDDVLIDHRRIGALVVGDAVEQGLQVVGAALEDGLPRRQALVVGHQAVAPGAVLLRRRRRRQQRHAGLPQPDVGLLIEKAARLLEVAVDLAGASGTADLIHQLGAEATERRHDAALEVRHVVEDAGRHEERHHRRPGVDVDFAGDELRRHRDGAAFARRHVARCELRIVVDVLDDQGADREIEHQHHDDDAPGPAPQPAPAARRGSRPTTPSRTPGLQAVPAPAPQRGRRRGGRAVVRFERHGSPYHSSRDETGATTARVARLSVNGVGGMALDPESQRLIDLMAAANRPAWNTLSPQAARDLYLSLRPAAQGPRPAEAKVKVVDRTIAGPAGDLAVRIYRPASAPADAKLPCLVYAHGGGWVFGNLDSHDVLCAQFALEAGIVVFAVDYRLAPEARFPGAFDDVVAGLKWVAANGASIGVDPTKLAVGGDSAGGNLAAAVA